MTKIDQIKNGVIEKILAINRYELLSAFNKIFDTNSKKPISLVEMPI